MKKYIIALDQGTTGSRALIFDNEQNIIASAYKPLTQYYPKEGYVEHDASEIFLSQSEVMAEAIAKSGLSPCDITSAGITNQRETTILWNKKTGEPVSNAIVWQCRRTAGICEQMKKSGLGDYVKNTTGLVIDAYFSATKIKWLLDSISGLKETAESGDILFGTVDSWLIWKLTKGKVHATDYTNASRTMIFDINKLCWDKRLLKELGIPECILPEVRDSSGFFGNIDTAGASIPICAAAGDQQAALFGQCCFEKCESKNTYGTGCFLLMNTGKEHYTSSNGLITTIAASMNGEINYALEGSVFVGGAVVQWLRDELRLFGESADSDYFANKVEDNGGVYVVPSFTGLGAPHWDMYARGAMFGLTRGTKREHIIRASLESVAFQSKDVIDAMESDTGLRLKKLSVDGGASANEFLMRFQADILGKEVERPKIIESTALGAAMLAGLSSGVWKSKEELRQIKKIDKTYSPAMDGAERDKLLRGWSKAVERAKGWAE